MVADTPSNSYDEWHDRLDVDVDVANPWHDMVRRHLDPGRDLEGRRVLEIGCGRGGFACWLASRPNPPRLTAIDFSAKAVEKARAHASAIGLSSIEWQVGTIEAIDHADGTFDTAISCETVEHVLHPAKAVSELARVLKPGGTLFLTTPNYLGVYGLYRVYLRLTGRRYTEMGQPINQLTMLPRTLYWVRKAGLRVEAVFGEGHYLLRPGRHPKRLPIFDQACLKWIALHSFVVASKPARVL